MDDEKQKKVFSENLKHYLSVNDKTQKELADGIGVSPQLVNTWTQAKNIPRMGKIDRIAEFLHIRKSDLIDEKTFQYEIGKLVESIKRDDGVDYVLSDEEKNLVMEWRDIDDQTKEMIKRILAYGNKLRGVEENDD